MIRQGGDKARFKIEKYYPNAVLRQLTPPSWRGDPGDMTLDEIRTTLHGYLPV